MISCITRNSKKIRKISPKPSHEFLPFSLYGPKTSRHYSQFAFLTSVQAASVFGFAAALPVAAVGAADTCLALVQVKYLSKEPKMRCTH